MISFSEEAVPLADIRLDEHSYQITTVKDKDDAALQQSITDVGLLSLPILQPSGSGSWRIVTGFRRLKVLSRLKTTETICRVVCPAASALDCLKISIIDNTWQRSLNPGEQARALHKLSLMIDGPDQLGISASALGLPSTAAAVKNMLAVQALPDFIFDHVSTGEVAVSTALSLTSLEPSTAVALAGLFVDLKLGGNRQRTAMTLMAEISLSEDITMQQLLDQISSQDIINDPLADRALRSERLFHYLRLRRFPRISSSEMEFARKVKALKPGPGARLSPPPDFEGVDYTLQLRFKDEKDLRRHIALLGRIADSDLFR
jgi:hypothetical protein